MSSFKSPSTSVPRSSPFRRPASPASPSNRPNTPPSTTRAAASPMTSPSKLKHSYTVSDEDEEEEASLLSTPTKTSHYTVVTNSTTDLRASTSSLQPSSPQSTRRLPSPPKATQPFVSSMMNGHSDPLTRLPPPLLHSLRESFAVLDPNSTGYITPASVHETLQSLGLDTSTINTLFPPGTSQSVTLPQYLNQMANILVNLSPQQELLNALSAFDDDDSGQIDVEELKRALLTTPPDAGEQPLTDKDISRALDGFTGRRILGKNSMGINGVRGFNTPASSRKGGEVFRYQEFVGSVMGTTLGQSQNEQGVRA